MVTNMAREDTLMSLFSLFGAPGEFETIGLPPEATEGAEDFLGTGPAFFPTLLTSVEDAQKSEETIAQIKVEFPKIQNAFYGMIPILEDLLNAMDQDSSNSNWPSSANKYRYQLKQKAKTATESLIAQKAEFDTAYGIISDLLGSGSAKCGVNTTQQQEEQPVKGNGHVQQDKQSKGVDLSEQTEQTGESGPTASKKSSPADEKDTSAPTQTEQTGKSGLTASKKSSPADEEDNSAPTQTGENSISVPKTSSSAAPKPADQADKATDTRKNKDQQVEGANALEAQEQIDSNETEKGRQRITGNIESTPTGRKPGGQLGHKGSTLVATGTPDKVIVTPPEECLNCSMRDHCAHFMEKKDRRVIYDIYPNFSMTAYYTGALKCPLKRNEDDDTVEGKHPEHVRGRAQYGFTVQAFVVVLFCIGMVSMSRIALIMSHIWGLPISVGTIASIINLAGQKGMVYWDFIRLKIRESSVIYADETSARVYNSDGGGTVLRWIHCAVTESFT